MIKPLGWTIRRSVDEVVGDLVQPVLQRLAESVQRIQAELTRLDDPAPQTPLAPFGRLKAMVFKYLPQRFTLLAAAGLIRGADWDSFRRGIAVSGLFLSTGVDCIVSPWIYKTVWT